ncbi:unnamed protein product [Prorocentrum cordatum]|uniref:Uncharacterized protein n=1 Tax=Prorocentrum cordatum TaxID=2364126 RepID=A0ABN9PN36_9DINO|nr:unnamed protein product [Polarella glacialis]
MAAGDRTLRFAVNDAVDHTVGRHDTASRTYQQELEKRKTRQRATMAYQAGEQGDMRDLILLSSVERRERVERLPLLWGSVIWLVVAILAMFLGYFFAPLQKQQYRFVGLHLLAVGPRAEWKCSLMWCSLSFDKADRSCNLLRRAFLSEQWEDKPGLGLEDFAISIDSLCEGDSLDIVTYKMPSLCNSEASLFFSQACRVSGFLSPCGMVAAASTICTILLVAALVTHAIVLWFLVNDYQLLVPPSRVEPRWKLPTKLRSAARHCSRMCGIAALATGLIYCAMIHWIEADGGFLTFTALGYVLTAPEQRAITPGAGLYALVGIADVFILALIGKEIFKAPVTPSGLTADEHKQIEQIEMQANQQQLQPQQPKAQPPQALQPRQQPLQQPLQLQHVQPPPPLQVVQPWAVVRSAGFPAAPAPAPPGFGVVAAQLQQQSFQRQQPWPTGWQRR